MPRATSEKTRYTRFPSKPGTAFPSTNANLQPTEGLNLRLSSSEQSVPAKALSIMVVFFILSLFIPIRFNLGSLLLSPSRIVLLLTFLPCLILWISGKAGRRTLADACFMLLALWVAISLLMTEGVERLEFAGITAIEILTPYLIARCYIHSKAALISTFKLLFGISVVLAPVAAIESTTGIRVIASLLEPFFSVLPWGFYPPRLGLYRAQTVFEHSILYGSLMAFLFAPTYYIFRASGASAVRAFLLSSPILFATFFSLSAGAYLGLLVQVFLIGWQVTMRNLKNKWWVLLTLTILGYILVDILSNRTPFQVFSSYIAFDQHTAYWRVLIFKFGIENVWAHPLFGLGLGDWERPAWMYSASVDNLWLVFAMRHGIPGFLFLILGYLSALILIIRSTPPDQETSALRTALVFSLIGLGIAICTVHLWNATFQFAMFMLGAGQWVAQDAIRAKASGNSRKRT